MTTYYVATNGNNNNPGTLSQPWRTVQKAGDTAIAGDLVYIRQGTYNERVYINNSGISGSLITFASYPGEVATIDGTNILMDKSNALIQIVGKKYLMISGLHVINSSHEGIRVQGPNVSNITIKNNYISNTSGSGISVWGNVTSGTYNGVTNVYIDYNELNNTFTGVNGDVGENITVAMGVDGFEVSNNHIHDIRNNQQDVGQGIGGEGIDAKQGVRNGKIYSNHVHHIVRPARATIGIYVGEWDRSTYNIDVFNNNIHDIDGYGFVIGSERGGPVNNIGVFNNICYNNKRDGIMIDAYGAPHGQINSVRIINNTVYGNGLEPGRGGIYIYDTTATNVSIRNNIVSQNREYQIAVPTNTTNVVTTHNLIDGYRGWSWSPYSEIYGQNSVTGNPMFVNASTADFHLQSTSPAIDRGTSLDTHTFDFDYVTRPQGAGYDIGAYEYIAKAAPLKTSTLSSIVAFGAVALVMMVIYYMYKH